MNGYKDPHQQKRKKKLIKGTVMIIQLLENFALWLDDVAQVCSYFSIMIIVQCLIIYYVVVNVLGE